MSDTIRIECQEKAGLRRIFEVIVPTNATVQTVREALAPLARVKVASILLFEGDEYLQNAVKLEDAVKLEEYEITADTRLVFEARMCGLVPGSIYNCLALCTTVVGNRKFISLDPCWSKTI